jgi:hypothetical protein
MADAPWLSHCTRTRDMRGRSRVTGCFIASRRRLVTYPPHPWPSAHLAPTSHLTLSPALTLTPGLALTPVLNLTPGLTRRHAPTTAAHNSLSTTPSHCLLQPMPAPQAPYINEGLVAVQLNLAASKLRLGREHDAIKHAEQAKLVCLCTYPYHHFAISHPPCSTPVVAPVVAHYYP